MSELLENLKELTADARGRFSARFGSELLVSDRVKVLIAAAGIVLFLFTLFAMHQGVTSLERRYVKAETDSVRLRKQIETNLWQQRKQESQVLKAVLVERMWTAQTPGLAQANFERWLHERLARYRIEPQQPIQIRLVGSSRQVPGGGAKDPLSDVQRMSTKIVLPFDQQALASFLADLAESDKAVVVDHLNVRSGRNARVDIDVSAFYYSPVKN